jgi:pimeloyl-ACP methyl ester carboxylesterase
MNHPKGILIMKSTARWLAIIIAICASVTVALSQHAHAADTATSFDIGAVHVERHGEQGTPVILIPGLASGAWVWKDTIAALKTEHRVYAITLAGFDGRPAVKGDLLAQAAASLHQLIVVQKLDKPVLVGHSLGGTLSLLYASAHSSEIGGVVAVDGLPVFPSTEGVPAAQRPAMAERVRAQFSAPTQAAFEVQQLQYMRAIGVVDADKAAAAAKLSSRSDRAAVADYAAAVMALDLRPQLPAIRVPVLEVSPYFASDYAAMNISEEGKRGYYRALLDGVPKLEVVSIPQSRHFAMIDQPQALNEVLAKFLRSVEH